MKKGRDGDQLETIQNRFISPSQSIDVETGNSITLYKCSMWQWVRSPIKARI